jgi:hypothetical protein
MIAVMLENGIPFEEYQLKDLFDIDPDHMKKYDFVPILKVFYKHGINLKIVNNDLFRLAIISNNINVAKYLLEQGVDVNLDNGFALLESCKRYCSQFYYHEMIILLLRYNVNQETISQCIKMYEASHYYIVVFLRSHPTNLI